MKKDSDNTPDWQDQRKKIIGLGESSLRKSYYPELREMVAELEKKNDELHAAYEQLASSEEELRENYDRLSRQEQALRENEEKYRNLVENTFDGVVIFQDDRVMFANRTAARLLGCTGPENLVGRSLFDFIHPDDFLIVKERSLQALDTIQLPRHGRFRHDNGTAFDVDVVASPTTWEGKPAVQVAFRDITAQITAETALRESESFYRTVFDTTGSGSVILDENTTIVRANEGFARLSGFTVEELEGKHRWTEFVVPEDLVRMQKYHADRREASGQAPRTYEFQFLDRYGTVKHCLNYVAMIPGTKRSIASIVDISGRVLAERELEGKNRELQTTYEELRNATNHFEAIYEGSPDLIYVHAADGHIIDVNENVLTTFDLTRKEALVVDPSVTSGKGYTPEMAGNYMRSALETGQVEFDWVCRRKTGEEFPVDIRLRRIEVINERGERESRILALVRDITERRMAEGALEQARKKLGLLNTVIFQDIQSTIFALSAYLQLANSAIADEKSRAYVEKEAFLIHKIVSSLNFARNYQDMGINPPRWQGVNQVFLYAISHLDSLKVSRNLQVSNLEIYADPLLEKVFFNLVENIFLHGQHASAISLEYAVTEEGLLLILKDNGIGIPPDEKQKIFERGYGKNTGLGLFLVREILSITGITIRETGELGKGARFEMVVPKGAYRFADQK